MNKQKSYHHPTKNPNFFSHTNYFFSVQLGHLKLSGYGLLSTQGVQNRSQNCWIISQSEVILQYMRDPGSPAACRPKGVKLTSVPLRPLEFSPPKSLCGTVGSLWVSPPATLFGFWETLIKFTESMVLYGEKSFFRFFFFSALSVVTQNSSGVTQKDTSIAGLRMFVA